MALSEYADWWDRQKRTSEAHLTEWVQENPQWWAVGIAGTVGTAMDLGAGMVDVLRLGEGVAQGGWRGVGQDAMRLLVVLGPLGRAGGMASRFAHVQMLRLAVQPTGLNGPCTFMAVNNALKIVSGGTARNLFITARDAAAALGRPLKGIAKIAGEYDIASWVDDLIPFLRTQGARIRTLTAPKSLADIAGVAQKENGVVIFAIRCTTKTGEAIYHTIIAVRDQFGVVRYADYGGRLCRTVEELVANLRVGALDSAGIQLHTAMGKLPGAVVQGLKLTGLMENAMVLAKGAMLVVEGVTAIETNEGTDLAVPVATAITPTPKKEDPAPPAVVKASFEAFVARKEGRPVVRMPTVKVTNGHAPPRAEWLTGVQYRLNALGFGAGPVDGKMGPKTRNALHRFQKAYPPLMADALPGPRTQAKLVEVCGY